MYTKTGVSLSFKYYSVDILAPALPFFVHCSLDFIDSDRFGTRLLFVALYSRSRILKNSHWGEETPLFACTNIICVSNGQVNNDVTHKSGVVFLQRVT